MSKELKEAIYQACLESIEKMGMERVKQMSWFGKKHK